MRGDKATGTCLPEAAIAGMSSNNGNGLITREPTSSALLLPVLGGAAAAAVGYTLADSKLHLSHDLSYFKNLLPLVMAVRRRVGTGATVTDLWYETLGRVDGSRFGSPTLSPSTKRRRLNGPRETAPL